MGQKVNPTGFRIGTFRPWKSRWYAEKNDYRTKLLEDIVIRQALMERLKLAGITAVEIERLPNAIKIALYVARPGVVIGRGGSRIEETRKFVVQKLSQIRGKRPGQLKDLKIELPVMETDNPETSALLVSQRIALELERRMPHRRVVTRTMERVMQSGAAGIRVVFSGRIGGADISRVEKYQQGSVPTQTLKKDIDYAQTPALLKKGYVGIKVWINKK